MIIELSEQERLALIDLVEHEIAELGPEIRHTDTRTYREDLKARKHAMRLLREHLEPFKPEPTQATSWPTTPHPL